MDYSKYNKDNSIVSVARALDIIDLIANHGTPLKMSFISEALDIPKVTTFRTLNTLVEKKYLSKKDDDTYFLGLKFISMGIVAKRSTSLISIAQPHVERLRDVTGEGVNLGILNNDMICNIIHVPGDSFLLLSTLSPLSPMYCASIGKVFLIHKTPEEREAFFSKPLKKLTKNTVTTLEGFEKILTQFAETSVVYDDEEFEYGLSCIAAPIYDCEGTLIAGVSVTGPTSRLKSKDDAVLRKHLLNCASAITKDMEMSQYKASDFYKSYA